MPHTSKIAAELVQTAMIAYTGNCLGFSLAALSIWEYFLTFAQTIELVWNRQDKKLLRPQPILLLSTRVCMLSNALLILAGFFPGANCSVATRANIGVSVTFMIGSVQMAVFTALRAFALFNRNMTISVIVLTLGLAPLASNIYVMAHTSVVSTKEICATISDVPQNISIIRIFISDEHYPVQLVSRLSLIVADLIVLILTWVKTYRQITEARRVGMSVPISTCLIRDGTAYFLCFLVLNIVGVVTYNNRLGTPAAIVISALPPILINRFILNLRQAGGAKSSTDESENLSVTQICFNSRETIAGSMGEPLNHVGSTLNDDATDDEDFSRGVTNEASLEDSTTRLVQGSDRDSGEV